jgi:hypothetical protein
VTRPVEQQALRRAKARLDTLSLYPRPVRLDGVRIWIVPRVFRLPFMRRFHGYTIHGRILLCRPPREGRDDLVTHELCHVWQLQHQPVRMPLSFLKTPYRKNGYEREARWAEERTKDVDTP